MAKRRQTTTRVFQRSNAKGALRGRPASPAPRNRKLWTAAELRKLAALARKGLTARETARELGRTASAVRQRALVDGISFRGRGAKAGQRGKAAGRSVRRRKK